MLLKQSNCNFLTEQEINCLKKLNILTVEQLISHADLESLSRNSKISLDKLKLTYKYLVGQYASLPQTGVELLQKYIKSIFILKTGSKIIDDILHGGIYSSEITEIYGESNTGKTRLCINIAATLLVALKPTLNQITIDDASYKTQFRILYIDSCNNFCPKLFSKIIKNLDNTLTDDDIKKLFCLVSICHCRNIFDLNNVLFSIEKESKIQKQQQQQQQQQQDRLIDLTKNLTITHLLIIDNFNILFNILRSSNTDFLSHLHYTTRYLKYLSDYLNIAVIMVNTTTADRYSLGNTWNSLPNVRLLLTKVNNEHTIELIKSTRLESSVTKQFEITENGIK